jgi:hypothetical protein
VKIFLRIWVLFFGLYASGANAQTDTSFWFVAPEVAQSHSDRPIAFRLTSGATACSVRVYTPANPSIYDNTVYIPPQTVISLDVTPQINLIENDPPNQVLNRGFKIQSTAEITAYYEVISNGNNPDIFALKGENALGTFFLIPGQRLLSNVVGHERIDVVASQNNTTIYFTPTADLFQTGGGIIPAGTLLTVTLNAGQTYCFRAASQAANISLAGSTLTSDQPVAVTYIDDSVLGAALGGCGGYDLLGDQLIPVPVLGNEFIVIRGYLTNTDLVTVTALTGNTQVSINGVAQTPLAAGQTLQRTFTENVLYITSNEPVNVMHVSGYGCETGMAILPPIQCTGSQSVGFQRTSNSLFALNLFTKTSNIGGFMLNGVTPISSTLFQTVPGSLGLWSYARVEYPNTSIINTNTAYVLSNSQGSFHMGLINVGAGGCRYGYFSDYARFPLQASTNFSPISPGCPGDLLRLFSDSLAGATYTWRRPDGQFFSNLRNPTIPGFSAADTGMWTVFAIVDGCSSAVRQVAVVMGLTAVDTLQQSTCDSISWNGTTYRQSGYYSFTTANRFGCDSTVVLELDVRRSPVAALGPTGPIGICSGDSVNLTASPTSGVSYQWFFNGVLMTGQSSAVIRVGQPGFYRVRVANSGGCDDTSGSVELRVASTVQAGIAVVGPSVLCPGQPVTLQATPDTGASYQWFLNGAPLASTSSSIQVNQAGNYRVRVYTGSSCDDTTATISINPGAQPQALISALGPLTVCPGGVVNLFSTTPPPVSYQWLQDSLPMAGQNNPTLVASAPGLYRLIVTNPAGCADTSVELRVNWRTPPVVGLSTIGSVNLCIGDSVQLFAGSSSAVAFEWQRNGVTLAGITQSTVWVNQPGLYRVFVTDSFGCLGTSAPLEVFGDTSNPASLGLVGVPNLCSGIPAVLVAHPSGGTYTWLLNGQPLGGQTSDTLVTQQPGLYSVGVVRPSGCTDTSAQVSVAGGSVVQAVINGPSSLCLGDTVILSASPTATGVSYQWLRNGVVLAGQTGPILQTAQGGLYAVRVLNTDGCFDTARIQLAERPTSTVVITPQICRGDVFQVGSQAFNATGNYIVTLSNRFGCDSIIQMSLTVSDTQRVQVAARICAPATYVFGGQTLNSSGLYQAMFANASGCDSLVVVDLTVAQPSSLVQSIATCDSLVWGNRVLRNPGLYRDTTINAAGCDSISTLNLSIGFTKRDTVYRSACDSFLWDGQVIRQSGQYTRSYTQPTGCDSIVRLALDLGATVRDTLTQFSCDSFIWMGQIYRQSGTYLYQSQSAQGCDSLLTLQLTLANRSFTTEQIVVCDSLTWNGQTLTQSGTYTVVLPNASGCDSVVSLALEVYQSYTITENITACDSFLWQGQTLRASGVYRLPATSAQGCDSSRVLNLILGNSSTVVSAVQACGRYSWMGSNYIQSGLYWWRGTGSGGCDSAVGINLTILPIQREVYSVFSCDNYVFGSRLLSQGGTYRDTFVNTLGCDSIVTLNLSIDPTPQPPFPIDTNLCLVQGAQIPYSGPMTHELVWYAHPGDSVFLATGQRFNLIRNFDTLRVLISFRSPGGCLSPPALVRVINDDEPRFPVRPTAFTPNNDGRNDEWFVESTDVMTLLVFDRWGRLIHKDSGQTVRWNGGDYTPGTYPYILEKISCMGKVRSTHGLINLIR